MKTAGTAPAPPDVFRDFGGFLLKKCDREATTRSTQKRRVTLPWQDPRIPLAEGNPYKFGGFSAMVSGHVFLLVTTPSHIIDRFWKLLIQYIYQWLGSPKTYGKLCFQDVKVSGWLPHNFQISNLIEFHTPINCHNRQYTYVYIYIYYGWVSPEPMINQHQSTSININQHQSTSINHQSTINQHQSTIMYEICIHIFHHCFHKVWCWKKAYGMTISLHQCCLSPSRIPRSRSRALPRHPVDNLRLTDVMGV
jgi:hypothetical protein